MKGSCNYKEEGTKLIRITLEYSQEPEARILKVQIRGDFFLHPEELIQTVEENLLSCPLHVEQISFQITETLTREQGKFIGASPDHIAKAIIQATQN